jgi:hypothetical protein
MFLKYLIILLIMYSLTCNLPSENMLGKNPLFTSSIVVIVIYLLDTPNVLLEKFTLPSLFTKKSASLDQNNVNSDIPWAKQNTSYSPFVNSEVMKTNSLNKSETIHPASINPEVVLSQPNVKNNSDLQPTKVGIETDEQRTTVSNPPIQTDVSKDSCDCNEFADKAITKFLKDRRILDKNGMLHYADDYFGDMGYSQLRLDNYIPLGAGGDGVYNSWDMSQYSVLNTNRWKPTEIPATRCKTDVMPDPQPVGDKIPLNLMNWDYSRRVLPHDNINVKYINEKLNNKN